MPFAARTLAAIMARVPLEQIVITGTLGSQVVDAGADEAIRQVPRAVDVALVALRLLAHVEHFDLPLGEQAVELLDLDRLELFGVVGLREVAAELEEAHRAKPERGLLGVLGRRRVDRDGLVGGEDERCLRRKGRARDRDVEGSG